MNIAKNPWVDIARCGNPEIPGWYEIMYEGKQDSVRSAYFDGDCWVTKELGNPLVFGDPVVVGDCYRALEVVA